MVTNKPRLRMGMGRSGIIISALGGVLLICSALVLCARIPREANLKWIPSSEVTEFRLVISETRRPSVLYINTRNSYHLRLRADQAGFSELNAAIGADRNYALGYIDKRDLFSGDTEHNKTIRAIAIDGKKVVSVGRYAGKMRHLGMILLAVGMLLICLAAYLSIRRLRTARTLPRGVQ